MERYAIDALVDAGARLVSVAEPALTGSEVATIQFHTHRGLPLVAVVSPAGMGWFDPLEPIFEGDAALEQIRGVDVLITLTPPDHYAVASVGWSCGGYDWWFDAVYGDVDEYRNLVDRLIGVLGCS